MDTTNKHPAHGSNDLGQGVLLRDHNHNTKGTQLTAHQLRQVVSEERQVGFRWVAMGSNKHNKAKGGDDFLKSPPFLRGNMPLCIGNGPYFRSQHANTNNRTFTEANQANSTTSKKSTQSCQDSIKKSKPGSLSLLLVGLDHWGCRIGFEPSKDAEGVSNRRRKGVHVGELNRRTRNFKRGEAIELLFSYVAVGEKKSGDEL